MKKSIKSLIILILLFVFLMPKEVLASEDTLPSGLKKSEIGSVIEDYVEKNEKTTAGLALSVFDEKGVFYENYFGYGDKEKELPVDEQTVFEWGSVTKLMVWVSLMQLEEQGKVDFNTDIRTYLPKDYLGNLSYETPITITHLFNHEAGFQDFIAGLFEKQGKEVLSLGETLKLYQPPQIYELGYTHGYSNWSTALGGYIVENISGMTFSDYVHENIMSPLDMKTQGSYPTYQIIFPLKNEEHN